MQIAFHIGANCTDEDRLLKSILANADTLLQQGIAVPGPGKYRSLLRQTIQGLDGATPAPDTREILLDAIVENDDVDRIVLCNDNFIAIPKRIFDHGVFYPQTEGKVRGMRQLFPQDELSFFLGIRHPVSFLQEVATRAGVTHLQDYLGLLSPLDISWADVVRRIRHAAPDARVCVWCNEDTPLIWEDLIRLQTDVATGTEIKGQFDMLSRIITKEGMQEISAMRIPADRIERHEMIADVIDIFANPEVLEETIDLPELGPELIDAMSEGYEDDIADIGEMEGVELILPFT